MTFHERYKVEKTWHGRAQIMEIFHLAQRFNNKEWRLQDTAQYFQASLGLVSENLRLADLMHTRPDILNCSSRQEALKRINYGQHNVQRDD